MSKRMIILSLLLTIFLSACNEEVILHRLDELRANRVKVALAQANIEATKIREGELWSIAVPSSQVIASLSAIEESRILKKDLKSVREHSSNFLPSREEQKNAFVQSLCEQLELTLESLPGVLEARVHVYHEEEDPFSLQQAKQKKSASVLMLSSKPDRITEDVVKQIVAGASGIAREEISVLITQSDVEKISQRDRHDLQNTSAVKKLITPEMQSSSVLHSANTHRTLLWQGGIGVFGVLLYFVTATRKKARSKKKLQNTSDKTAKAMSEPLPEFFSAAVLEPNAQHFENNGQSSSTSLGG